MNTLRQPLPRRVACLLMILLLLFQSARAVAPGPAWWTQHGVLDPDGARDDFAAANIGQLKYLATQADAALDEAEAASPVPLSSAQAQAKSAIDAMTAEWSALPLPEVPRDDFLALNAGQLKHVASLFYDRLGLPPPWAGAAHLGDDFRMVNVGQLKQAFSFELRLARGGPPVQIPASWWDTAHAAWAALDSTQRAAGSTVEDFNGNGLSNLEEYLMHPARLLFDPDDKDGDRIPDVAEAASGGILSPLVFADAVEDHDNDGVMNYEEVLLGLNLNGPVTTGRADSLTDAEVLAWGLLAGVPLAPGTDAVRACWEAIDEAWIEQQGGMEFYGHWLDRTPASGVPAGWTAFQAEFWGPTSPDAASIQYPPTPIDLDGDDIPDMDRDGDGLPDLWEYRHELDLRGAEDAWDDPDGDTLVNLMEFANGTNPRLADTDGDGFSDAEEGQHGGDPRQGGSVPPVLVQIIGESAHMHYPGQTTPALAVRATQGGIARMGFEITFTLTAGNGVLSPATQAGGGSAASLTLSTGADGIAAVTYTAAAQAEQAQVQAAAAGAAGPILFNIGVIAVPGGFAGAGTGGGEVGGMASILPTAARLFEALLAGSDGMFLRHAFKLDQEKQFPSLSEPGWSYLGAVQKFDPVSSGSYGTFDPSLPGVSHHRRIVFEGAVGPCSRTYLVLLFQDKRVNYSLEHILSLTPKIAAKTGTLTFSAQDHKTRTITLGGSIPPEYIKKTTDPEGNPAVDLLGPPPSKEEGRFWMVLLPVEVKQPTITGNGTAGALAQASELRLSRWDCRPSGSDMVNRSTFAELDPDRIVIRLPVPRKKGEASVKVKVSTTGSLNPHSDPGAELDFKAESPGSEYFVSDSLAIVSDTDDDELTVGTGNDNATGDRTFISRPGGKLRIDSADLGSPIEVPIKGFTHAITVQDIFLGMHDGERRDAAVCYNENRRHMRNIYAQNLVRIDYANERVVSANELRETMSNQGFPLGTVFLYDDLRGLLKLAGPQSNTIKILWISSDFRYGRSENGIDLPGRNLGDFGRPDVCLVFLADANRNDSTARMLAMTEAHEIGHALGLAISGGDHVQPNGASYPAFHLMCRKSDSNLIIPDAPDRSAKHWFIPNDAAIKSAPQCRPASP